jgi:Leucine-rich repeat (LRR) protein
MFKIDKSQKAIKTEEFIAKEVSAQLSKLMPNPSDEPNYSLIEELNLHNCELTELDNDPFKNTRSLKKLTLSFNKLKSIRELNTLVSANASMAFFCSFDCILFIILCSIDRPTWSIWT